jgi:hypothetical protein
MNIQHSGLAGPSALPLAAHDRRRLRDAGQHQITAENVGDVDHIPRVDDLSCPARPALRELRQIIRDCEPRGLARNMGERAYSGIMVQGGERYTIPRRRIGIAFCKWRSYIEFVYDWRATDRAKTTENRW